jgi:small subunit ribosomal protein S27Ae
MARKPKKPKKVSQVWKLYEKEGEGLKKKNKECPKCGPGVFLANHKKRRTCGKCQYTEFKE